MIWQHSRNPQYFQCHLPLLYWAAMITTACNQVTDLAHNLTKHSRNSNYDTSPNILYYHIDSSLYPSNLTERPYICWYVGTCVLGTLKLKISSASAELTGVLLTLFFAWIVAQSIQWAGSKLKCSDTPWSRYTHFVDDSNKK